MSFSRDSIKRVTRVLWVALGMTLLLGNTSQNANAGVPEHLIKMNRVDFEAPIQVIQNAQVKLHNNWGVPLHETTIRQMVSDSRLAMIDTIAPGQTVNLEFPAEGKYSVCYSLEQDNPNKEKRCLYFKVIPMKTA